MTLALSLCAALLFGTTSSPTSSEDPHIPRLDAELRHYNEQLIVELQRKSPEVAALFRKASDESDANHHEAALSLYQEVLRREPSLDHAMRRSAYELMALKQRDRALALQRHAIEVSPSAVNYAAIIEMLVPRSEKHPSALDLAAAVKAGTEAIRLAPNDFTTLFTVASAAAYLPDQPLLSMSADGLVRTAPGEWIGYYYRAWARAMKHDFIGAFKALNESRDHGLPKKKYDEVTAKFEHYAERLPLIDRVRLQFSRLFG